jgi:hypothetical protein
MELRPSIDAAFAEFPSLLGPFGLEPGLTLAGQELWMTPGSSWVDAVAIGPRRDDQERGISDGSARQLLALGFEPDRLLERFEGCPAPGG